MNNNKNKQNNGLTLLVLHAIILLTSLIAITYGISENNLVIFVFFTVSYIYSFIYIFVMRP